MGDRSNRALKRLPVFGDQPSGERPRASDRHLLAQYGADSELVAVDVSSHPASRREAHESSEQRIVAQRLRHAPRVGVEVEQRARALHRRGQVAQILQPIARVHVPSGGAQLDDAAPLRQTQAPPVDAVVHLLDARHRAQAQERDQPIRVQRRSVRESQRQRVVLLRVLSLLRPRAQLTRRHREHFSHRRVELAHALKARGERDACDRHSRRLEQDASGLRALCSSEREWPGADRRHQLTVDMALGVAQAGGEAADALAVDHPVCDQAHRASDEVRAQIPIGRARRRIGTAALARAKASRLCRRRGREEANVLAFGCARRTTRTAVDPRRLHTTEDPPVKARITEL